MIFGGIILSITSKWHFAMTDAKDCRIRMDTESDTGECGDMVEMFLGIKDSRIQSVSFDTNGCINTNACANTVSHLSEGKTIEEAWEITPEDVVEFLETLPKENYHCADLAVGAFYLALANYQELQRNPWKKPYQCNE